MTVIFNDTLGVYGGSQSLMLRMSKWLKSKQIDVCIICDSATNIEVVSELKKNNVRIEVCRPDDFKFIGHVLKEYKERIVINFGFVRYLNIECIKKKYKLRFDNIIYDIIPATFLVGTGFKNNLLRKHIKRKYLKTLLRMVDNNSVISQEETNNRSVCSHFGIDEKKYNPKLLRIPMDCKRLENCESIIKEGYKSKIIMTAARADFPFKGYMIGLIDEFKKIKEKDDGLILQIFSAGGDIEELKDKIRSVPDIIRKDIVLNGWITYSDLYNELKKCKIYIGLGSSLMDACLNYKPTIVVSYDTRKCVTAGTFDENPFCIGTKGEDYFPAGEIIEKIIQLDYEKYKNLCFNSFEAVNKNYNIDSIMTDLLNTKTKNSSCILTFSERLEHNMNNLRNKLRSKKNNKNAYHP